MPLIFNKEMPVYKKFEKVRPECLATEEQARDGKVIKLLFFNLMKNKIEAEEQFLRCLSNTKHTISVEFLRQSTYESAYDKEYLEQFYLTAGDVKDRCFDAMIITGAPLDQLDFEDVFYWEEVCSVLDWSKKNVKSVFHSCWGALAGLYHDFGVSVICLPKKVSGIFKLDIFDRDEKLFTGMDNEVWAPISRAMDIDINDVSESKSLIALAGREGKPPVYLKSADNKLFYSTAHPEYGRERLMYEYNRDKDREYAYQVDLPKHYFPDDNPEKTPLSYWIKDADKLFENWIEFYVAK